MPGAIRAFFVLLFAGVLALNAGCGGAPQRPDDVERLRQVRDRELSGTGGATEELPPPAALPSASPAESREATERPRWVALGVAREYSSDRYIVGIASARRVQGSDYAAMNAADDRARGEVAKSIQVRISAEFKDAAELITQLREGEVSTEKQVTAVAQQITSATSLLLEGVVIADRWYDAAGETWWALAVMERDLAGRAILDRMARRLRELQADLATAREFDTAGKAFQALGYYNGALKKLLTLLNLRAQLRAIAPNLGPEAPMPDEKTLADAPREAVAARERSRIAVYVEVSAPGQDISAEPLRSEIERGLRELGLKTVRVDGGNAGMNDGLRSESAEELAKRFGNEADALLLAQFTGKEVAVERMVNMDAHFWQARGEALIVDLDARRVVSSAGFDYLAATHTGMPDARKAAEGALSKAAREMASRLRQELVADLNLVE
jgi:hypothetical protein